MRLVPTRRLAVVAIVASLVVLVLPGGGLLWPLVATNAVLVLIAIGDAAAAFDPTRLEVARELPPVVPLGASAEITWRLRNPLRRRVRVTATDALAPSLGAATRQLSGTMPPRARLSRTTEIRPTRRGRFDLPGLVVRVDGPLGLGAKQRLVELPGTLRVHPPFRSREEAELRINRARILEIGLRSARGRGGGTEFDQLREYGVDDDVRRIDWAASARANRTMIRTYRAERNQHVLVLLDTGRTMAGRVDDVPRVEHAIDAALCLTAVATRLGDKVGLLSFDRDIGAVLPARSARDQLGRVSEAVYAVEPELVESDYAGAFAYALTRFRRRALIVLLTDLVEQAVGESLLPALPILTRQHVVVVAAVRDPDVAAWATTSPDDIDEAYRAAAAASALDERQRAAARLRGLGARVVDSRPGALAADLADTYLDLKAVGRL